MNAMHPGAAEVIAFWRDAGHERWFVRDAAFDAQCRTRFLDAHLVASRREFEPWMADAEGALGAGLGPVWLNRWNDPWPLPRGVVRITSLSELH